MQRVRGGGNAVRAVACLPALTGAWRHRAGGVLLSSSSMFPVDKAALQRPDLLAGRAPRTINMITIGDDLLREASTAFGPKIEAVLVYNSNPSILAIVNILKRLLKFLTLGYELAADNLCEFINNVEFIFFC